jgi:small subunit ribosomal protein S16
MPTKIRLQRKGKKGMPFYHVVIADGRAPRDGKFIERIGIYNPVLKPAEIDIKFDRALYWLQAGAQPTDTVRALLSSKGILLKYHLLKGVKKGALTEELAEAKFEAWLKEKQEKHIKAIREVDSTSKDAEKKRLAAEAKVNEARAKELAAKRAKELAAAHKAEADEEEAETAPAAVQEEMLVEAPEPKAEPVAEEPVAEEPIAVAEPVAEEPVAEEPVAAAEPVAEEPVAEEPVAAAEPVAEEPVVEEPVAAAEPVAEEPVAEEPVAEEPAAEEETEAKA